MNGEEINFPKVVDGRLQVSDAMFLYLNENDLQPCIYDTVAYMFGYTKGKMLGLENKQDIYMLIPGINYGAEEYRKCVVRALIETLASSTENGTNLNNRIHNGLIHARDAAMVRQAFEVAIHYVKDVHPDCSYLVQDAINEMDQMDLKWMLECLRQDNWKCLQNKKDIVYKHKPDYKKVLATVDYFKKDN